MALKKDRNKKNETFSPEKQRKKKNGVESLVIMNFFIFFVSFENTRDWRRAYSDFFWMSDNTPFMGFSPTLVSAREEKLEYFCVYFLTCRLEKRESGHVHGEEE